MESAAVEELKKVITSLFARLGSDRADLANDESTLVQ
jgi:hypothetical protein